MKSLVKESLNEYQSFERGSNPHKKLRIGTRTLQDVWDWIKPEDAYEEEDAYLLIYSYDEDLPHGLAQVIDNWEELYAADEEFQQRTAEYGKIDIEADDSSGTNDLIVSTETWTNEWNEANGY